MDYFPSIVGEYRQLKNGRTFLSTDLFVTLEGVKYFVGTLAQEESEYAVQFMAKSKIHNDTKVIALSAIHRVVNHNDKVFVVMGNPIDNQTESEKEGLKNLLFGEYIVAINGVTKHFTVERVEVATEGASSGWGLDETLEGRIYHVIDLGSRTCNLATIKNKTWNDKLSKTLDFGCETFGHFNPSNISRLIYAEFSRRIGNQRGDVYAIGGVASQMQQYYAQYFSNVKVPEQHTFLNARSFYNIGVKLNEKA